MGKLISEKWPRDRATFDRRRDNAQAKYQPLVDNLDPPELWGLWDAVTKAVEREITDFNVQTGRHVPTYVERNGRHG